MPLYCGALVHVRHKWAAGLNVMRCGLCQQHACNFSTAYEHTHLHTLDKRLSNTLVRNIRNESWKTESLGTCQAMGGSLAEVEWEGILHWKTWALASLDCCISTTKCVSGVCTFTA